MTDWRWVDRRVLLLLHDESLAEHATDFEQVSQLNDELRRVESEQQALEEQWLELLA